MGICFQIKDDIFDYYDSPGLGKPTGNDMLEGKLTLPAIHAVNTCGDDAVRELVRKVKEGRVSADEIARLIAFTKEHGGIDYARRAMQRHYEEALALVRDVRDEAVRAALEAYAAYVVERTK